MVVKAVEPAPEFGKCALFDRLSHTRKKVEIKVEIVKRHQAKTEYFFRLE